MYSFLPLRLEQQVQDKEELERKLYSRFVPVMNEKKAKIRSLQDELQHLQRTDDKQSDKEERQRSAWDCFKWIEFFGCFFLPWLHIYECRSSANALNCIDTPLRLNLKGQTSEVSLCGCKSTMCWTDWTASLTPTHVSCRVSAVVLPLQLWVQSASPHIYQNCCHPFIEFNTVSSFAWWSYLLVLSVWGSQMGKFTTIGGVVLITNSHIVSCLDKF